jgi:hypothetical protein
MTSRGTTADAIAMGGKPAVLFETQSQVDMILNRIANPGKYGEGFRKIRVRTERCPVMGKARGDQSLN